MQKILFIFILTILGVPVNGQGLKYVQGEFLIKIASSSKQLPIHLSNQISNASRSNVKCEALIPQMGIWKLSFDHNEVHQGQLLSSLKHLGDIVEIQRNHLIEYRELIPNDPLFELQWPFLNSGANGGSEDADLDAELAWDHTTGGVTLTGDTIVVAVFDNGVDPNHEDLFENIWRNYHEIPDNGIDDDQNGYIDDYMGWNISNETDEITGGDHGSSVAGIIGARGNNGLGISGVNWDIKLMIVKQPAAVNEALILEAYAYAYAMRKLYNESNGERGAFVVATNSSFGINYGKPEDAPLWCSFFDSLGTQGILNCAATSNINVNVDQLGDLPTSCESEFLLTVTNLDNNGRRVDEAGYGEFSIDLGAFGVGSLTTRINNEYGTFDGTSAATPQVSGAVALLYSGNCDNLALIAKSDPPAAALLAKNLIMQSTIEHNSLSSTTKSGGSLNLNESLLILSDNCSECPNATSLKAINIAGNSTEITWIDGVHSTSTNLLWRKEHSQEWSELKNVNSPVILQNLSSCSNYQVRIQTDCNGSLSLLSDALFFLSDGCCTMPEDLNIEVISSNAAYLSWPAISAADNYTVRLRLEGNNTGWVSHLIEGNTIIFDALDACTAYEVEIQSACDDNLITEFGNRRKFITLGCGACTDIEYCQARANNSHGEWIERFKISNLQNHSGIDNGYGNYTGMSTDLVKGEEYTMLVEPGFGDVDYPQYYRVWIDYNQNGSFEDESEMVYDSQSSTTSPIEAKIQISQLALEGITRLRIVMKYINNDIYPSACENGFGFGEVEDYCINILKDPASCDLPISLDTMGVEEEKATLLWSDFTDDHSTHNIRYRVSANHNWQIVEEVSSPFVLENLSECTTYEVQVEANCAIEGSSGYSQSLTFSSECQSNVFDPNESQIYYRVFPNPFIDNISIELGLENSGDIEFNLFDLSGRKVRSYEKQRYTNGIQEYNLTDLGEVLPGIYLLKAQSNDLRAVRKVIKY